MTQVRMRFDAALDAFLPPARRRVEFAYDAAQRATAKHAIEALGVPHTEVGTVRVDTRPVALDHLLRDGERLHVGAVPPAAAPPEDPRFVADAHLGRLARHLRFLGFDTLQRNAWDDAALDALDAAPADGEVPPAVRARHDAFWRCPSCRRVYWRGSHWRRLRERVEAECATPLDALGPA
jgi:hypothetical protein